MCKKCAFSVSANIRFEWQLSTRFCWWSTKSPPSLVAARDSHLPLRLHAAATCERAEESLLFVLPPTLCQSRDYALDDILDHKGSGPLFLFCFSASKFCRSLWTSKKLNCFRAGDSFLKTKGLSFSAHFKTVWSEFPFVSLSLILFFRNLMRS